MTLQWNNIIIE